MEPSAPNLFSCTAALAAYRDGAAWRTALLACLRRNRDRVTQAINRLPGLSMDHVEATYLAWIDTRAAGIAEPGKFFEKAGVGLGDGVDFGGPGFVRLGFACPQATLAEALTRISRAMQAR